jgi:two-component system cell cycle sensor histidine kinase/response regulator CckA
MESVSSTVMVVDDEAELAELASIFLQQAGYEVIVAHSAKEALELWHNQVELLLTDWILPDVSGGQLAACLLDRKSTLKVLFVTGNSIDRLRAVSGVGGAEFIQKPYLPQDLICVVQQMMAPEPVSS